MTPIFQTNTTATKDADGMMQTSSAPTEKGKIMSECNWCKYGDEYCGSCRNFFADDGSRCSAEYDEIRCAYYEPINYCPNCGRKLVKDNDST